MSHFTTIKTQLRDRECLKKSLEDMGYTWREGDLEIAGFGNQRERVELAIYPKDSYPIGFCPKGGKYEIVADW